MKSKHFSLNLLIFRFEWGILSIEMLYDILVKFSTEVVMDIQRDRYLNQLISYMWDGQVKVITGIRRCGKSYLLRVLFRKYLLEQGMEERQILSFELDLARDIQFRNPILLSEAVRSVVEGSGERFYLFIDEIQMSDEVPNPYNPEGKKITFYDALNDLRSLSNLDISPAAIPGCCLPIFSPSSEVAVTRSVFIPSALQNTILP